jgi:hypothetical protein
VSNYPDPQIGLDFAAQAKPIEAEYEALANGDKPMARFNPERVLRHASAVCLEVPLHEPVHSLTEAVALCAFQVAYRKLCEFCQQFNPNIAGFADFEAVYCEWENALEAVAQAFPRCD